MMKFQLYLLVSVSLAVAVICRALFLRPNFWSASILLASSNGSLILLTNVALITTGGFVWALQRLLYGPLRPIEVEQLYEKGWMAVTETLLSLTIFREDIGTRFFVMFLTLMAGKVWEWIGEGRVEFLEQQPPANPLLFHSRLTASLTLSVFFDCFMLGYCLQVILQQARPGMMVMYGFEFTILSIQSVSLMMRYMLTLAEYAVVKRQTAQRIEERKAELRREREAARVAAGSGTDVAPEQMQDDEIDENEIDVPGWEDKGRWIFYLDLVTDFIKSIVYCGFFVILLVFHGLPIHIMRDLYITVRSFCKRILDFIQYRQATKNMNERYSDATVEDLQADNTCIICREEMIAWGTQGQGQGVGGRPPDERQRAKKLPCGHILHFSCLRSWLERQRVCPTCRRPVLGGSETATGNGNAQNQQNRGRHNHDRHQPIAGALGAPAAEPHGNNGAQNDGQNPRRQQGFRVYNFGPLRIALGQGNQAADLLNNAARPQQDQQQNQRTQPQNTIQTDTARTHPTLQNIDSQTASNPALVHQQIVQLQSQVLHLMRQLNGERLNLDVLERLVAELMRLQDEQRNTADPSQAGSSIGHYRAQPNDVPRVADDSNLPPGMVLPPGYTLQRLHPVNTTYSQISSSGMVPTSAQISSPAELAQTSVAPGSQDGVPTATGQGQPTLPPPSSAAHSSSSAWGSKESASTHAASSSASATGESSASSVRQRNPLAASVEDVPATSP